MVSKVAVAKKEIEFSFDVGELRLPAELMAHPLLQGVSPQTLTSLSNSFDVVKAGVGALIYHHESHAHTLYVVTAGAVRTVHRNVSGETLESAWTHGFSVLGLGELLGGSELMQESAYVDSPATMYTFDMTHMRELAMRDAALAMNLARALAWRHQQGLHNERALLESAFVRVAQHIRALVQREATQVAPDLYQIAATQDDIAAATGLNPRTIARAMKTLQEKGRLYIRRGQYLVREPMTLCTAVE